MHTQVDFQPVEVKADDGKSIADALNEMQRVLGGIVQAQARTSPAQRFTQHAFLEAVYLCANLLASTACRLSVYSKYTRRRWRPTQICWNR
jgi:hypothetical protein